MGFQPLTPRRGAFVFVPVVDDDPIKDWIYYSQLLPPSERCHLPEPKALPRAPPSYASASLRRDVGGELGDAKQRSNIPGRLCPDKAERLDECEMVHGKGGFERSSAARGHSGNEDEDEDDGDDDDHESEK